MDFLAVLLSFLCFRPLRILILFALLFIFSQSLMEISLYVVIPHVATLCQDKWFHLLFVFLLLELVFLHSWYFLA